jgi:uncharacterized protein YgiM (DUF1202 family)
MRKARLSTAAESVIVAPVNHPSPGAPGRPARDGTRALRLLSAAAACLCLSTVSCSRERRIEHVEFPTTPVLTVRSTWAVVVSPLLRVREQPDSRSTVLQHIRQGVVVEVMGKSDREDEIEGQQDYWYRINYEGLKGWVFGPYLTLCDSRAAADAEAARLR